MNASLRCRMKLLQVSFWRNVAGGSAAAGLACRRQLSKLGQWSTTYLNELPEVQDMVNDVDIDGDGQRMCFCQAAWQWFLLHLVVKLLGGWVQSWLCRHDVFGTVQGI